MNHVHEDNDQRRDEHRHDIEGPVVADDLENAVELAAPRSLDGRAHAAGLSLSTTARSHRQGPLSTRKAFASLGLTLLNGGCSRKLALRTTTAIGCGSQRARAALIMTTRV